MRLRNFDEQERGPIVLCANYSKDLTRQIAEYGCKTIGYIAWATAGLHWSVCNKQKCAIKQLIKDGFGVIEIHPHEFLDKLEEVDCLYFAGGNSVILRLMLNQKQIIEKLFAFNLFGGTIVACSEAAATLGKGNLFLNIFSPKPTIKVRVTGKMKKGLELHEYAVIKTHKETPLKKTLAKIFSTIVLTNTKVIIIEDGKYKVV